MSDYRPTPHRPARLPSGIILAMAAAVAVLLHWLMVRNATYEWYFAQDMDMSALTDGLRIRSNITPFWLHHTSFTLYLVHHLVGLAKGAITGEFWPSLAELSDSLSPIYVLADVIREQRQISPPMAVAGALLAWAAVRRALCLSPGWSVASLALALTTHWVTYHSLLIRSELFSIAPWALALLLGVLALETRSPMRQGLLLVGAGLLLGLAFLSKVQTVILVAAAPLFWVWLCHHRRLAPAAALGEVAGRHGRRWAVAALFLLAVLWGLVALGWAFTMPKAFVGAYFEGAPPTYGISKQVILLSLALVAAAAVLAGLPRMPRSVAARGIACAVILLVAGLLASFLCHFLLHADLGASWRYLLADFKVAMMRMEGVRITKRHQAIANIRDIALAAPVLHGLWLLTVAGALVAGLRRDRVSAALVAMMAVLVVFQALFIIRPMPRDTMFYELLMFVTGAMNLAVMADAWGRRAAGMMAAVVMVAVLAENIPAMPRTPDYTGINNHVISWSVGHWFEGDEHLIPISKRVYGADDELRGAAARQGLLGPRIDILLGYMLHSHTLTTADIGPFQTGARARRGDTGDRLADVPAAWAGATLLDLGRAEPRSGRLYGPRAFEQGDIMDHLRDHAVYGEGRTPLMVLTRRDLSLALLVPAHRLAALAGEPALKDSGLRPAILRADGSRETMALLDITSFLHLPADRLPTSEALLVVKGLQ